MPKLLTSPLTVFLLTALATFALACGDDGATPGVDSGGGVDSGLTDTGTGMDTGTGSDTGTPEDTGTGVDTGAPIDAAVDAGEEDSGSTDASMADVMCLDPDDPLVSYVSESAEECLLIDFACESDFDTAFSNACGCGCVTECPAEGDGISYVSRDVEFCRTARFVCEEGIRAFTGGPCGCGCMPDR